MRAEYLDAAVDHLRGDPLMGPLVADLPPPEYRITDDHFFELSRAIVFQQLSGKAAGTIWGRFLALVEELQPERVLGRTIEEMRDVGLSRPKASYLHDLSTRISNGDLDLSKLAQMSDDEVRAELTRVKGFGVWSADMHLMFGMGRPDVLPLGDLGVRKGFLKLLGREAMTPAEMEEVAEPWRPYRSVASHYMWRFIEKK